MTPELETLIRDNPVGLACLFATPLGRKLIRNAEDRFVFLSELAQMRADDDGMAVISGVNDEPT